MKKPDYDTADGIRSYLVNLDGLNRLIKDRGEAGYSRKERLNSFIIMGRWSTDTCGNWGSCKLEDYNHKEITIADDFPMVLSHDGLKMRPFGIYSVMIYSEASVPKSHLLCNECGKGWDLCNAHDTYVTTDDEYISAVHLEAGGFLGMVGKTLTEIEAIYQRNTDGAYFVRRDYNIRNDKLIDLTPDPKYPDTPKNRNGSKTVEMDYALRPGDEVCFYIRRYQHKKCHDFSKAVEERKHFDKIFNDAGFYRVVMSEIPNGYCPCEICAPWQSVKTLYGVIKIGWRKSVINIDWSDTKRNLEHLFLDEKVTKGADFIHAYGAVKASEYLTKIRIALSEMIVEQKKDRSDA